MSRREVALQRALVAAFAHGFASQASVVIQDGEDNLIRRRRADDGPGPPFCVIVEGLPNLLHEFVHAAQYGALEDDHGIDYGRIPFDVAVPAERQLLWDELACCLLSCAYLERPAARVDAWFAEQIGIQGVFWGVSGLDAVISLVEATRAAYPDELEPHIARAYDAVRARLLAAGAPLPVAEPVRRWSFATLWGRLKADCS